MDAPPLQVSQCTLGHCWLVDSTEETASWYGLEIVILIGPLYHLYILTIDYHFYGVSMTPLEVMAFLILHLFRSHILHMRQ